MDLAKFEGYCVIGEEIDAVAESVRTAKGKGSKLVERVVSYVGGRYWESKRAIGQVVSNECGRWRGELSWNTEAFSGRIK